MNNRIREVRKHLGLSMRAFGERIGISSAAVSKIESGVNTPSEQTLRSICSQFRINRLWLEQGLGDMHVQSDLIPELVHALRQMPAVQLALERILPQLTPEDLQSINSQLAKFLSEDK